jgi:hypothetical protein
LHSFNRLLESGDGLDDAFLKKLLDDKEDEVKALALGEAYERKIHGMEERAERAVRLEDAPEVAKQAILSIGNRHPKRLVDFWRSRSGKEGIDPEVWLDLYYAILESKDTQVQSSVSELFLPARKTCMISPCVEEIPKRVKGSFGGRERVCNAIR